MEEYADRFIFLYPYCGFLQYLFCVAWHSGRKDLAMKDRCTAILLAAGAGRRMRDVKSNVAKQYMMICGKPLIWYALQVFEASHIIDDVILVVGRGEVEYARVNVVEQYGFQKVDRIIEGGTERYLSVKKALRLVAEDDLTRSNRDGYLFIHDSARPFITEKLIEDTYRGAQEEGASCAAVPVKDTIKMLGKRKVVEKTLDRKRLYAAQTPQVFFTPIIIEAYKMLEEREEELAEKDIVITDDAMVVETMLERPVKLVESYDENIKVTTPMDLEVAKILAAKRFG